MTGRLAARASFRQREIIAATFKVDRDSAAMSANDLRDNFATLVLSQSRLRAQVDTLVQRLVGRVPFGQAHRPTWLPSGSVKIANRP